MPPVALALNELLNNGFRCGSVRRMVVVLPNPQATAVPFTPYKSDFDANTLQVLQSAFDRACLALLDLPDVHIDEQMARDLIAKRIVAAAHEHGERDPDRLVRYAGIRDLTSLGAFAYLMTISMGLKRVAQLTDFRAVVLKRLAWACTEVWQAARLTALAMSTTLALLGPPALAQDDVEVDLELVLAVDISLSMDDEEQRLQRDGYVAAIRHPEVIAAIRDGPNGQIALAYLEWAGAASQKVLVAWSLIDGEEAANNFAEELAEIPLRRARRTSISGALQFAQMLFKASVFRGLRQVVDVSGDGANNQGTPVPTARDLLVDQGIVINGLAIMIDRQGVEDYYHLANLDDYFEDCVIGGPGAFVMRITDQDQFATAIRRKMILEIGDAEPRIIPAAAPGLRAPVDCLTGEKRWQRLYKLRE